MRLLHTSDWHLGHSLHGYSRAYEHARFLAWLLDLLEKEAVDALLISGDIFDSSNPPADALACWYRFLADVMRRMPEHFRVVVIGGNHDSVARLNAPRSILEPMRVHVVGGVPRTSDGALDAEAMSIPLYNRRGEVAAWCAAMPYIRVSDLGPRLKEDDDYHIAAVARLYDGLFKYVAGKRRTGQALVAMGHCFMSGGQLSEDSERKILGGNQHALPLSLFPRELAYAGLGHLHLRQALGREGKVRYSGSPIPLSFRERGYKHGVFVLDLEGEQLGDVREHLVPRVVQMERLKSVPEQELDDHLAKLEDLTPFHLEEERPLLEVSVKVTVNTPGLRQKVEKALEGKAARLLKLTLEREEREKRPLATAMPGSPLRDMKPELVFAKCVRRRFDEEAPEDLTAAFAELMEQVQESES